MPWIYPKQIAQPEGLQQLICIPKCIQKTEFWLGGALKLNLSFAGAEIAQLEQVERLPSKLKFRGSPTQPKTDF